MGFFFLLGKVGAVKRSRGRGEKVTTLVFFLLLVTEKSLKGVSLNLTLQFSIYIINLVPEFVFYQSHF